MPFLQYIYTSRWTTYMWTEFFCESLIVSLLSLHQDLSYFFKRTDKPRRSNVSSTIHFFQRFPNQHGHWSLETTEWHVICACTTFGNNRMICDMCMHDIWKQQNDMWYVHASHLETTEWHVIFACITFGNNRMTCDMCMHHIWKQENEMWYVHASHLETTELHVICACITFGNNRITCDMCMHHIWKQQNDMW